MSIFITISLLCASNFFMLIAWYGHLKYANDKPIYWVILISWLIAFLEYCLMIPANRVGSNIFSLSQLKIMQEVITLAIFIPFSIFVMSQPVKLDFLWAALCMIGAVYFIFRG